MSRSITATIRKDFDYTENIEELLADDDTMSDEEIRDFVTDDLAEEEGVSRQYITVEIRDEDSPEDSDSSLLNRLADAAWGLVEDRNGSAIYLLELIEEARNATPTRLDRAEELLDRVKTTLSNFPEFEHNQARYGDILDDLDVITAFQIKAA